MKKTIFLLIFCLSLMSCEYWYDDDTYHRFSDEPVTLFEINVGNSSLSSGNNVVETSLGKYDENESAVFQLQAQHYKISELDRNPVTGEIIYKYQPKEGFTGRDNVEIIAPTDRNGNRIFESKTFEFQINVSQ